MVRLRYGHDCGVVIYDAAALRNGHRVVWLLCACCFRTVVMHYRCVYVRCDVFVIRLAVRLRCGCDGTLLRRWDGMRDGTREMKGNGGLDKESSEGWDGTGGACRRVCCLP